MKLTFILLTTALLNVSAKGTSQTVTLTAKDQSLRQVFSIVEQQTGFTFFYNEFILEGTKPVNIQADHLSLEKFLQQIFDNQPLEYVIKNKSIIISKKVLVSLSVALSSTDKILAPPGSVRGRVTNENGDPLVAANVTMKGTNFGAVTDNNGYYRIENITPGEYIVVVSFIGYATKTTAVKVPENGTATLNFNLTISLVNLDQLTVTSTLSARKIRSYPATIAEIKQEDLKNRNINNIANVLEAIPGIIITPGSELGNSGNIKQPSNILIRGTSAGAPIKYLIDGIDVVAMDGYISVLQTMDFNDVEKIEVLKGPMASTLYGSGAAGGIISITTKKGKQGKTHVNFKTMFTQYANEYADYSGYSQDYSLNVSGGNEQFNYLFGAGYNLYPTTKLTDINNGIDQKTWAYNARIGGKAKNIAADLSFQYGNGKNGAGSTDISFNKYRESLGLSTFPVYPLDDSRTSQQSFLTSLHLTHTIADNFYQDLTVGYNVTNYINSIYTPQYDGSYSNAEYLYSKMNARYFVFYDHSWSLTLKTSITAGFEYNGFETHTMFLASTTPPANFFTSSTPAIAGSASYTKSPYSSTGYFAEAVTDFQNNLFLTTGIRYDVDPAYGDNVGAYAQPRVGLSYVIEPGKFKIKPRAVWGVSSLAPSPLLKITTVDMSSPDYTFITVGNLNMKPQRSEGYEFGADLFYGSNYSLNLTYYDQKIKDMIQSSYGYDFTTTPLTFYTYYYNIAKAINRGVEISAKALVGPFTMDLSYTQTTSKWGDEIGQTTTTTVYPGAPNLSIPKKSLFARLSYKIPSLLPWTEKGGRISIDWRYNGAAYNYDFISYYLADQAWQNLPDPKPANPDYNNYLLWQKGYSYFNLRADYSVTNYTALYIDVQNLLNKQGSINGQSMSQFPGRRINFGINVNF